MKLKKGYQIFAFMSQEDLEASNILSHVVGFTRKREALAQARKIILNDPNANIVEVQGINNYFNKVYSLFY